MPVDQIMTQTSLTFAEKARIHEMNIRFWAPDNISHLDRVICGVSERTGGVSLPPRQSLNLKHGIGDHPIAVIDNRRLVTEALGFSPEAMVCAEQIHGNHVAVVGESERGRGAVYPSHEVPGVDALVTNTPDLLLSLFFADCLPIFFVDPVHRAIGLAHAGWRGLVAGIIENTLETMGKAFGTDPADILAAIGPGIGPCCFEVGADVAENFPPQFVVSGEKGAKPHVDLKGDAVRRLVATGISGDNIAICPDCTSCFPERWFSHRRDNGQTGRMGAFLILEPTT